MVAEEVTPFRALAASSAATEAEAESVDEPEKALVDLLDVSRNPSIELGTGTGAGAGVGAAVSSFVGGADEVVDSLFC